MLPTRIDKDNTKMLDGVITFATNRKNSVCNSKIICV